VLSAYQCESAEGYVHDPDRNLTLGLGPGTCPNLRPPAAPRPGATGSALPMAHLSSVVTKVPRTRAGLQHSLECRGLSTPACGWFRCHLLAASLSRTAPGRPAAGLTAEMCRAQQPVWSILLRGTRTDAMSIAASREAAVVDDSPPASSWIVGGPRDTEHRQITSLECCNAAPFALAVSCAAMLNASAALASTRIGREPSRSRNRPRYRVRMTSEYCSNADIY
jgi:hypothetical protein